MRDKINMSQDESSVVCMDILFEIIIIIYNIYDEI